MKHVYTINNKKEVSEQLWFDLLNNLQDYFSQIRANDPVEFIESHRYAFLAGVPTTIHSIKIDESFFCELYFFHLTQENEALGL